MGSAGRREFLKTAMGAAFLPPVCARGRGLGAVVFCRMRHRTVADAVEALGSLLGGAKPVAVTRHGDAGATLRYRGFVASYEEAGSGEDPELVLCGAEATLVVSRRGYRLFG